MERHWLGAAAVAKLTTELGGTDNDRVLSLSTMNGWDFTAGQVFAVAIDRGLAVEEKVLCVIGSRNADGSGTLSVLVDVTSGHVFRGWDETTVQRHQVGAKVEHIWAATDAREVFGALRTLDAERAADDGTWRALLAPAGGYPPLVP